MIHFYRRVVNTLVEQIKTDKTSFIVYSILRAMVIAIMIRCFFTRNFESMALCGVSLILFLMPALLETKLKIEIPTLFEIIIYLFIFSAEILGEINHFYVRITFWDTMLHTLNGFLCAVVGFSLIDILNRKSENIDLSPLYLSIVAFCFSMTVGVVWEFFEFSMDFFFNLDMQKDFIVQQFGSVTLDPNQMGTPILVKDITDTLIHTASGETFEITGGYLDIGILDTMKDLLVNFVGAIVFSIIGYFYVSHRDKDTRGNKIANSLIIRPTKEKGESK